MRSKPVHVKINPPQATKDGDGRNDADYTFHSEYLAFGAALGAGTYMATEQAAKGGTKFVLDHRLVRWTDADEDGEEVRWTAEWKLSWAVKGRGWSTPNWIEASKGG